MLIYISPSASDGDFIRFIEDIVESIITKDECIVLGDFNIDIMTVLCEENNNGNTKPRHETICR